MFKMSNDKFYVKVVFCVLGLQVVQRISNVFDLTMLCMCVNFFNISGFLYEFTP